MIPIMTGLSAGLSAGLIVGCFAAAFLAASDPGVCPGCWRRDHPDEPVPDGAYLSSCLEHVREFLRP